MLFLSAFAPAVLPGRFVISLRARPHQLPVADTCLGAETHRQAQTEYPSGHRLIAFRPRLRSTKTPRIIGSMPCSVVCKCSALICRNFAKSSATFPLNLAAPFILSFVLLLAKLTAAGPTPQKCAPISQFISRVDKSGFSRSQYHTSKTSSPLNTVSLMQGCIFQKPLKTRPLILIYVPFGLTRGTILQLPTAGVSKLYPNTKILTIIQQLKSLCYEQ